MEHTKNDFYKVMLQIAIPVSLQSLVTSALNTLDTMMISSLGDATIAGVGLANQVFFFFIMVCFGISTGSSVMISQYWGRRDARNARRVNGLATLISFVLGLIFTLAAILFPEQILQLMTSDAGVVAEGARYLKVIALTYILGGLTFSLGNSLRSTGDPRTPLFASIVGFVLNAFFNYVFIFGALGFPRLGVVGAAVGTLIARTAEFLVIIYVIKTYDGPLNASIKESLDFDKAFLVRFKTIVWPVIFNETFWALGQVLYSVAYAIVGREATAAVQVTVAIQNIAFVVVRGLGSSCTIMIGNSIGRGDIEQVYDYAHRFIKISLITGLVIGVTMGVTPEISLKLFGTLSESVHQLSVNLLRVMGAAFIMRAMNSILIVGILRGGGDTRYSMILEMGCVWLVGVPLAFIGAIFLHLPIYWLVGLVSAEELVKLIFSFRRIRTRKWVHEIA
ncbi:MATE family efflux transporter [Allofustis seminis]|uniref:MATE family efflux transporter n=1 Tax=Allofustis seminis TaxID=166939 RepID=UPI00037B7AB9|nr:MATE family efflux transporter [Allofustis seminis]